MKNPQISCRLWFILLPIWLFFGTACEETGADYLFPPERQARDTFWQDLDSTASAQDKGVLIEDFTGVQCQNCPNASDELKRLSEEHPGRIVPVGIHSKPDNFTAPVSKSDYKSKYDLRTEDGRNIYDMLQVDGQLPKGAVDRKLFDFAERVYMSPSDWKLGVNQQLALTTPCNINISVIRKTEDEIVFEVTVFYLQDVDKPHYLTAYVLENDIEDTQLDGRNYIKDYKHQHVLRYIASQDFAGDLLENPNATNSHPSKGDVYVFGYTVPIEKGDESVEFNTVWNPENLELAAFVTESGGANTVHAVRLPNI